MSNRLGLAFALTMVLANVSSGAAPSSAASQVLPASAFSYDAGAPLAVKVARTWNEGSLTFKDLTFASAGRRVHAEVVVPKVSSPHPGVLFVHWLGDPKTTNLTEFVPDARSLAASGITSVLIDAMWAQPSWFDKRRSTDTDYVASIAQIVDLRRALDLLEAQPNVDPSAIGYVGHDFGAMYGAILSAIDPRPRCYVLMAGVPTLSEWYLLGAPPKDKVRYVGQMSVLDPIKYLTRSSARSFLFQFALKDEYVPLSEAERFASSAPGERAAFFYASDHKLGQPEIAADRLAWLTARLRSLP